MAVGTPTNVKVGAGQLFFGAVGAVEPTDLTTAWDPAVWSPVGYTEDGSKFNASPGVEPLEVAEELIPIRFEKTKLDLTLSFSAAELTVANILKAFNGGTTTPVNVVRSIAVAGTAVANTTGVVTTSSAHGLAVNDRVVFPTLTNGAPLVAGTTYYVKTVPLTTTLTLAATAGGTAITTSSASTVATFGEVTSVTTTFEPLDLSVEDTRIAIGWESQDHLERWVYRKCVQTGSVEIARGKSPAKALVPMSFQLEKPTGLAPFLALFSEMF